MKTNSHIQSGSDSAAVLAHDDAWRVLLAAARETSALGAAGEPGVFGLGAAGRLVRLPDEHPSALVAWEPERGWRPHVQSSDSRHALIDLYLPLCNATAAQPLTVAHLGQSLDGFIATSDGESRWITGPENLRHMHRLRALADAVVVGAGTVAADDPQLTTRLVPGRSPLRVIYDPLRRLGTHFRVFTDTAAETIYVCGRSRVDPKERQVGRAHILALDDQAGHADLAGLLDALWARGCHLVFVEGGGVTVSAFLKANLLNRLHLTVAPFVIGDGRPAIRVPGPSALSGCHRPPYRVFRMGSDVLFDCDLSNGSTLSVESPSSGTLSRII
ncbi:MAG: RibD family protein [Vicinamibacterales bacterium]